MLRSVKKKRKAVRSGLQRIMAAVLMCAVALTGADATYVFAATETTTTEATTEATTTDTTTTTTTTTTKKGYTGWKKVKGKYYYYKNGEKLKNTIAGTKKSGYYYVDSTGVRVATTEMKLAVKFIMKNSDSSGTSAERLKQCYKAMRKNKYKRYYGDKPKTSKLNGYAKDMFKNGKGNCYRFACAMAYIAKALGYEVRVAVGGVSAGSSHLSAHGWCEVKIGSTWRMIDVSMSKHHPKAKMYLVTRKNYPYPLRCDKVYKMKVSNGKVKWKA